MTNAEYAKPPKCRKRRKRRKTQENAGKTQETQENAGETQEKRRRNALMRRYIFVHAHHGHRTCAYSFAVAYVTD